MSFLLILLLILAAIALFFAWVEGLLVPKSTGVVVDKHTTTTYMTQGEGKTAYSIPLETFLLIDTFGRYCKVPRGVWANVKVGATVEGRWRGGSRHAGRPELPGPALPHQVAVEPAPHHCQRPLPPGAGYCPVCGADVRAAGTPRTPATGPAGTATPVTHHRTTPSSIVWPLVAAAAVGFIVILGIASGREPTTQPIRSPAANPGPTTPVDRPLPLQTTPLTDGPALGRSTAVSDEAPSWYHGSKPWAEIGEEGRATILRMRAAYETQQGAAAQPGSGSNGKAAADGRRLIDRIVQRYGLDPVYRDPDTFGPRMVIWLPRAAWVKLSLAQKKSIEAYMSSNHSNWGIGVGRLRGSDVLYDEIVVQH